MATPVLPDVALVTPLDGSLESLLASCGLRTSRMSGDALTALSHPGARVPDVLIVDTRAARSIPPAMSAVKRQHPSIGIIVVASDSDPAVLLEAMRAGATEFVQEPITASALEQAVSRLVADRVTPPSTGEVIAFVGAKGGVGTTTTAVNVASVLAKLSRRALLIDLHLGYGDAAVFLAAEPRFSLLDALENQPRLDGEFLKSLVATTTGGLDLLASADRAIAAPFDMRGLDAVVQLAASQYPFTVLDVPRSDPAVLDRLDHVDQFVVVVNQELATVRNAARMSAALRARYPNAKVSTVLNRTDAHAEIGQRDVAKTLDGAIAHELPNDYRRALTAMHRGQPLTLDNHNRLSASLTALARELAGLERDRPETTRGFKALFSGRRPAGYSK